MSAPDARLLGVEGVVAFTDLVGYTEYTALRGDAEALSLLAAQERIVGDTLPPEARVVKELGDGLLLFFPDPGAAIAAGVLLLQRFEQATEDGELPLWIRMGMHWGRPTRRGDDLVGHDVNVAARIVDVAAPGELLCSNAAVDAAGVDVDGVESGDGGPWGRLTAGGGRQPHAGDGAGGGFEKLVVSSVLGLATGTSQTGRGPSGSRIVAPSDWKNVAICSCAWVRAGTLIRGSRRKPWGSQVEVAAAPGSWSWR